MKLSLYSGNLSTYYKSITLVEGKNSCTSLIMNGLYKLRSSSTNCENLTIGHSLNFSVFPQVEVIVQCRRQASIHIVLLCFVLINVHSGYSYQLLHSYSYLGGVKQTILYFPNLISQVVKLGNNYETKTYKSLQTSNLHQLGPIRHRCGLLGGLVDTPYLTFIFGTPCI